MIKIVKFISMALPFSLGFFHNELGLGDGYRLMIVSTMLIIFGACTYLIGMYEVLEQLPVDEKLKSGIRNV
jgi:hypothetical protein